MKAIALADEKEKKAREKLMETEKRRVEKAALREQRAGPVSQARAQTHAPGALGSTRHARRAGFFAHRPRSLG